MNKLPSVYPADAVLRDGTAIRIRPIRRDDEPGLRAFFLGLSPESRALRFFGPTSDDAVIAYTGRAVEVDYDRDFGLVAVLGADERIVGHSAYNAATHDTAEASFAIADGFQGRGLGTILLGHLCEIAAAHRIGLFEALVLPHNDQMLSVFREAGFPINVRFTGSELSVTFPTALTHDALDRFYRRDQIAAEHALQAFFAPRGVAVIGASRRRGTIGGEIFHNVCDYGLRVPVYPVNVGADTVQGVTAYRTIEDVPRPVDLAILAVPASKVVDVAAACGRKGVRALVVVSAGFGEIGADGRARQAELLRVCRETGMRLIGPNCMGIINTDSTVRLNATFVPRTPPAGRVAFSSQGGGLGLAIIEYASRMGLGLSTFVSIGNKADISGNDLLNYWESDPNTDVILLYLESFGNPRRFSQIARRVARTKPIVAVKSGRSLAGIRATSSHTGALVAASDVTVDALFRQAGVIRTDTLEELFDVATLLASQPAPAGRRVAVVTNGGGPGILCADACEAHNLTVPELSPATQARLRTFLPPEASVRNPVDTIASAPADAYRDAIEAVAADPDIDAVVAIWVPPLVTQAADVARAILVAARRLTAPKPIVTVFMSAHGVPEELRTTTLRIPSFSFPESAAIALARAARYGEWRARPPAPVVPLPDVRRAPAAAVVATALQRGAGWLTPEETADILDAYGLPLAPQRVVLTPEDAGRAADEIGGEVALKAVSADLLHKTDLGGVRLHLKGAWAVREAARTMRESLAAAGHPVSRYLVQAMAEPGPEMILGVVQDPHFGALVACGAGGTAVELIRDVAVRLTPISRPDAEEMIRSLKTFPLLTGYRGRPPADLAALVDTLVRVGALADNLPQIVELDCNPIIAAPRGASIVDARMRVAPVEPPSHLKRRA